MNAPFALHYLFDPLCGWCYAAAPAIHALDKAFAGALTLRPTGLFAGEGARDTTPDFADYAWSNDQRIAGMTGQVFSTAYREQVLLAPGRRFDSGAMNRALTALADEAPLHEAALLDALQRARYVDGQDTADADVVARLVATVAAQADASAAASAQAWRERLRTDDALAARTDERLQHNQTWMAQLGLRGVPQLLVQTGDDLALLPSQALYAGPEAAVATLREHLAQAGAA